MFCLGKITTIVTTSTNCQGPLKTVASNIVLIAGETEFKYIRNVCSTYCLGKMDFHIAEELHNLPLTLWPSQHKSATGI